MQDKDYIKSIHQKIRFKKIQDNIIGSVGAISLCLVVFFTFSNLQNEDLLFNDLYDSTSIYEWEFEQELSDDEIYDFLIEYTCIEDYDTIEDEIILEWIEKLNLGG